jgi:hypothetical protein
MSASLARTADGWRAVTPAGLVRLGLPAATTAGLLADRAALAAAIKARAGRQMSRDAQPLLMVTGLSKTFPGLRALDGVDFAVHSGETADDVAWLEGRRSGPGRAGRSARACALPTWRNGT